MTYNNVRRAVFVNRPNRFIANVLIDGKPEVAHVKNTGRCRELLVPGAVILIQKSGNPLRKTQYDLISVYKGETLVNMDSSAPNKVFGQWLSEGGLGEKPSVLKAEQRFRDSRFDFYFEQGESRAFAEVKGVTLEENGHARFPDAPTQRGIKHILGLMDCLREGFEAYAVFIIQMENAQSFGPNWDTHPEFAQALIQAREAGVKLLALDCTVTEADIAIRRPVPILL